MYVVGFTNIVNWTFFSYKTINFWLNDLGRFWQLQIPHPFPIVTWREECFYILSIFSNTFEYFTAVFTVHFVRRSRSLALSCSSENSWKQSDINVLDYSFHTTDTLHAMPMYYWSVNISQAIIYSYSKAPVRRQKTISKVQRWRTGSWLFIFSESAYPNSSWIL